MSDTFEDAALLAAAALEWALSQLSDDPRLAPLARGAESIPLHVLARDALALVAGHLGAGNEGPPGDGPRDRTPSTAVLLKVQAALRFAYARALDSAAAAPEAALGDLPVPPYFETALRRVVSEDLEKITTLLSEAKDQLDAMDGLATATTHHLKGEVDNPLHRDWLRAQQARLEDFSAAVRAVHTSAYELAADLTFDGARRRTLPHPPLHGLTRREQQRVFLADALLLHETYGLTESEIGAIWADNPPTRAEAKTLGGKVLARARKGSRD